MGNVAPLRSCSGSVCLPFVVQDKRRNTSSCGNLQVKWRSLSAFSRPAALSIKNNDTFDTQYVFLKNYQVLYFQHFRIAAWKELQVCL